MLMALDNPPAVKGTQVARPWLRRVLWSLAAVLLLWGLSWLALPPLIHWQLEQRGSELLGRKLTVESVSFRPWSLELEVRSLRVAEAQGQGAQFSVGRLYMNAELQSLVRLAPVLDALRVEGPQLKVRHLSEGRLDIDDILQRLQPATREGSAQESAPTRFALFNIEVVDGAFTLVDEAVGVTHELASLNVAVPFLSNLASRREVVTKPRLAFVLNGSAFESTVDSTPFAQDRQTRARLEIPELDLAPYLPYWPGNWPVKPIAGVLHLDLTVDFEQRERPELAVSGSVGLLGVRVAETVAVATPESPVLLGFERFDVVIDKAQPLQRAVALSSVRLVSPQLALAREADGRLQLQRLASAWPTAPAKAPVAPQDPWRIALADWAVEDAQVFWRDASTLPPAAADLSAIDARGTGWAWPPAGPAPITVTARVGETPLAIEGEASAREARLQIRLEALPLSLAAPYLRPFIAPEVDGQLEADLAIDWRAGEGGSQALALTARRVVLANARLGPPRSPWAGWEQLELTDARIDLPGRTATVAGLVLSSPRMEVRRDAQGRWMFESWLPPGRADPPPNPATPPWQLTLADVNLRSGRVRLLDESAARPVNVLFNDVGLRLQNLQPLAPDPPESALGFQARVAALATDTELRGNPGRVVVNGSVRLPSAARGLQLQTRVQLTGLPLHAFEPYVADRLNLELLRADASFRGTLNLLLAEAGPTLGLKGDAALEDVLTHTLAPSEELLNWKSLQLSALEVDVQPAQPMRVAIAQTVLSDYFARIIIDPEGRINLQGLVKSAEADEGSAAPPVNAASASAMETAAAAAPMSQPVSAAAPPEIRFGPVSLLNGRVLFSDRFIRPNYNANLTELTGSLSAFSSLPPAPGAAPALATLSLKGRAEGTARLDIDGLINPLATPLALDIKAAVRELELPPLSPYSVKYAGHGIQRGKLSVDVAYKVEPDGRLDASHQIVLNQLAFSDRVEGSEAPNLPVKLAVALLADRNGVIDINLPVSGSLSDPQFRLAPIIFKLIFNLIGKAITAPFALIASAFGSAGADASEIAFEPGTAVLSEQARQKLDAVAKALDNRPALQLTVIGHSDLETERSAYQRARLNALLLAEKRRALARSGAAVPVPLTVSPEDYPGLLREAYRRADIPKPRNLIGIAKDIPVPEMEALMLAAQPVTEDAMRDLAVARAQAIKDHLASRQLPEARLFLGAPRMQKSAEGWQPHAELQLAPR